MTIEHSSTKPKCQALSAQDPRRPTGALSPTDEQHIAALAGFIIRTRRLSVAPDDRALAHRVIDGIFLSHVRNVPPNIDPSDVARLEDITEALVAGLASSKARLGAVARLLKAERAVRRERDGEDSQ